MAYYYKHTTEELRTMREELERIFTHFDACNRGLKTPDEIRTDDILAILKGFPVRLERVLKKDDYRDPDDILEEIGNWIRYELGDNGLETLHERFYGQEAVFDIDEAFGCPSDLLTAICDGNFGASEYMDGEVFVDSGGWYPVPMSRDELTELIVHDLETNLDENEDVLLDICIELDELSEEYFLSRKIFSELREEQEVHHPIVAVESC